MMDIGAEEMGKPKMNLPYEQPSLKKYGTMKSITLAQNGSGSDFNRTRGTTERDFSQTLSDTGGQNTTVD